jgi:hypothetical protein
MEWFRTRRLDKTSRWVVPGSRPFNPIFWPSLRRKEYHEISEARPKAAPLQALGNAISRRKKTS